ncbi:alpha/beta-hydrolase [Xylaria castorea]|nr:alpha/beta-hydrolase [Xylaria castorea]
MASKLSFSGEIEGPNKRLYIEREGNPTGPTILFVHGLGGTTNAYQTLVSGLQEFDLIRFDWSGHGRSAVPESTSIDSYVEDCKAVISHFRLEQVIVVGHSLGALISLHLAAKAPHAVKAMVLFGPVCPPPATGQIALAGRVALVRKAGMAAVADTVISNAFAAESLANRPGEVALAREMLTRQDPQGYALAVEALISSTLPELNCISIPIKVISGEEDKVSTVESGKSLVNDIGEHAEHISLPGVGHWYMLEASARCTEIIKSLAM